MGKVLFKKIVAAIGLFALFSGGVVLISSAQVACPETFTGLSKQQLEDALAACEKEIAAQRNILASKQKEGVSLERDIVIINTKIETAKLSIKSRNLAITSLVEDIGVKNRTIDKYSATIDRTKESLASLMRRTNELDTYSIAEVALSDKPLSEFFVDLDAFQYVEESIDRSLQDIEEAKRITEDAKTALEEKKNKETDLRYQKELEKKKLAAKEAEKLQVLKVTKGQEKEYQKVLKEKQARAAAINAALFALRDTGEIQFGQALAYANEVSKKTGVRPAFLLAIFMQESGFGKNQGSCYLKDVNTGAGVSSRTGTIFEKVMKPDRDVQPFLDITRAVGRDPFATLVSCPQSIGYGGAMGAAQFIPSTWILYEDYIADALGIKSADPWRARDAFMAAGLLLKDNGAKSGSYSAERDAACKYFSGSRCSKSSWAATYGSQVMKKAETIQLTMIDPIENL